MNPEKEKIPLRKYAIYRHYKGGEYTLLGVAKLESDLTDMAIYKKAYVDTEMVFVRPLEEFIEKFELV
ncbi:hypothetical protein HMPREF3136_04820 [Neisseria sp. HMSC15C08]|nr:hypothetical protein HMPREF3136_04820 [Neisseria sp. HMSC15C08]